MTRFASFAAILCLTASPILAGGYGAPVEEVDPVVVETTTGDGETNEGTGNGTSVAPVEARNADASRPCDADCRSDAPALTDSGTGSHDAGILAPALLLGVVAAIALGG